MRWLLLAPAFLLAPTPGSPPPEAFLAALTAALEAQAGTPGAPVEVQRLVLPVDLEHHADSDGIFAYALPDAVLDGLRARGVSTCDPCTLEGPGPRWTRHTVYATDTPGRALWEIYVRSYERLPTPGALVRHSEGVTRKFWVECPGRGACAVLRSERVTP
ncbi:MAG TPA: hypothetical protein VMK65_01305 [Longimicrobiales bacterium]|nr:hypothetical protein [Longimicrobiales bacterium]